MTHTHNTHPKGLSVNARILWIEARVSSSFNGPVANNPTPPDWLVAATKSAVEIQLIPGRITGYLHLNSFVIRVVILYLCWVQCSKAGTDCNTDSLINCDENEERDQRSKMFKCEEEKRIFSIDVKTSMMRSLAKNKNWPAFT